ncbi:MAG: hypothetical protein QM756_16720 [Polyangiaceae bacterium]
MSTLALAFSVAGALDACGDSSEEKLRAAQIAEGCSIDSDCDKDLVCAFEHCHAECATNKDCARFNARCVRAESGTGVCQLPDEEHCIRDKDCVGDEVCASDGRCRDLCSASLVCIDELLCANGGYCASDAEVDPQGNLVSPGAGGASNGGASGNAGSAGQSGGAGPESGSTGGAAEAGATSTNGGTTGTNGGTTSANGGTTSSSGGTSPSGGNTSSGGSSGGTGEGGAGGAATVDVDEAEPNETTSTPMSVGTDASVHATFSAGTDVDYYRVVSPGNAAGGYFEFSITDIPQGEFALSVLSGINFGVVGSTNTATVGQSYFGYWAAAPGETFLFKVTAKAGQVYPYSYVLNIKYTPAVDPLEPNDTRQTATDLALGVPTQGLLFTGYVANSITTAEYDDWYRVVLAAGPVTAALTNVPASTNAKVVLYNSGGTQVLSVPNGTLSADVTLSTSITTPGTYYLVVGANNQPYAFGTATKPGVVPAHFGTTTHSP